jgi:hypothetical protein
VKPTGHEIEWWYAASVLHAEADEATGRPWQCACGPCRVGREKSGLKTHYDLLRYGARKTIAYNRAMRGGT